MSSVKETNENGKQKWIELTKYGTYKTWYKEITILYGFHIPKHFLEKLVLQQYNKNSDQLTTEQLIHFPFSLTKKSKNNWTKFSAILTTAQFIDL